jgi:hypothetical protein
VGRLVVGEKPALDQLDTQRFEQTGRDGTCGRGIRPAPAKR